MLVVHLNNARAALKAAGFSNYHNYRPYEDFDRWLNNDQAVVITLNGDDGTFYALYRATTVPGGELETSPNPVQSGALQSLNAETIAQIVRGFDTTFVSPPKPAPARPKPQRFALKKGARYRVSKEGSHLGRWEPHPSGGIIMKRVELPVGAEITFLGQNQGPGSDPGYVQTFSHGEETGDFWPTTVMGLGIEAGWLEAI